MTNPNNTRRPTSHIAPFGVRMPPELKERLEKVAAASDRSLNAEIVQRLERSLEADEHPNRIPATTLGRAIDLTPDPRMAHMLAEMISEHIDKRFDVQMKPVKLTAPKKAASPTSGRTTNIAEPGEPRPIAKASPTSTRRLKIRKD